MIYILQAHVNLESGESLEDVDHSVLFYNQAIILYHLRQYRASLAILDRLFQYIDPLGTTAGNSPFLTHKAPPIICSRQQFQILLLFQK